MSHLRPEELSATLDDALHGEARERAERHLAECATCREALAALADQEATLREVLKHDPGEAYFQTFAARVEDRIRAAGLQGAQARLGREGMWGWLSPRRLAWLGAAAAVIGGVGIVLLTGRDQTSMLQSPRLVERGRQTEPVAPAPQTSQHAPSFRDEQNPEQNKVSANLKDVAPSANKESKLEAQNAPAQEGEAGAPLQERAPQPEPAADQLARGDARGASPKRAQEVRRNAAGEDVPVTAPVAPFAASPPASATSGTRGLAAAKPQSAAPMELQSSAARDRDASTRMCGRVIDGLQRPVAGATVALADRGLVTNTAADGRFCFDAAAGLHELSVMAVGYEPTRLQVRVEGESSEALVTLHPVSVLENPLAKGSATSEKLDVRKGATYGYLQSVSPKTHAALEHAMAAQRAADSLGTAAAYDAAAAAWSKVAPLAAAGVPHRDALHAVAASRYRAWQIGPTSARAKSARNAIDAFLAAEPAGSRKEQAVHWSEQLPH